MGRFRLRRSGAEAWPVTSQETGYRPSLEKVVIESYHPEGHGVIRLTPDQALYAQSRLSTIISAFVEGANSSVRRLGGEDLPEDHEDRMNPVGAKVWAIYRETEDQSPVLDQVVIESDHPDGHGLVRLTPEQARHIHDRLTQITLAFLHDYGYEWGGEDARSQ